MKKTFLKFLAHMKSLFLSGLFTILPIIITVFIVTFTYGFLAKWLQPLRDMEPLYLKNIPGSEFALVTLFILLVGFLLKLFFITPLVHYAEKVIAKIPFIRTIYSSSKTLVDFFNFPDTASKSRKVVLIEYPRPGFFNIAFLLEPATDTFQTLIPQEKLKPEQKYYKVFMPNSPSPATGFFFILPEDELIPTEMTFEEAIKTVVSCGLITPESLKKNK